MTIKNAFYAQSGGCTAVINATAAAIIETAKQYPDSIGKVFAGHNGILGALQEELIDTSQEPAETVAALKHTPGAIFGSCRYKLKSYEDDPETYQRLIEVFTAHNIGYLFYNGGGDSQDTINKIAQACEQLNFPLICIGVPKTIDNDIAVTDCCPGFGSVAKFIATTTQECWLDLQSMCKTSTKVFIYEVMGRHAGWIAASSGLAAKKEGDAPHMILLPEVPFNKDAFLENIKHNVKTHGACVIVVSEGIRTPDGKFLTDHGYEDDFGHVQLGGVSSVLAHFVRRHLEYKYHWAVADYIQRAAAHLVSKTDLEQAIAVGKAAVEFAVNGKTAVMPIIVRESNQPYRWSIGEAKLNQLANVEKKLPKEFIRDDGLHITEACKEYLAPLIQGEVYPPFKNGLPDHATLKRVLATKKLVSVKLS